MFKKVLHVGDDSLFGICRNMVTKKQSLVSMGHILYRYTLESVLGHIPLVRSMVSLATFGHDQDLFCQSMPTLIRSQENLSRYLSMK